MLCAYNGAAYIEEQLRSIFQQTRAVEKIVIYDDRSTDGTLDAVQQYVRTLPGHAGGVLSVAHNATRLGYSRNFAQGIERATGDVLFLCDQDDIWEPNKVERVLCALDGTRAALAFSDGRPIGPSGERLSSTSILASYGFQFDKAGADGIVPLEALLPRNFVNGAAIAVRRGIAQSALPVPEDVPHDYWLALWAALNGGVLLLPERLYRYRQHGANAIGLGPSNPVYAFLGMWRDPLGPRLREARRWRAICRRVHELGDIPEVRMMQRKAQWLAAAESSSASRRRYLLWVLASLMRGQYRAFAHGGAAWRDLIAVLR